MGILISESARASIKCCFASVSSRTTAADSTAGKVSDKTKDQTDMMKLMTDLQKRLSDLKRDVNQLKNEKFRPASRIASFKFWGRDCLMRILISESARASIKCCFASVSSTFSGTEG
jgi:hypothetical protein